MRSPSRDRLIHIASVYASARGLSLARVSTLACNDGKVLGRLAAGRDVTMRTHDAMIQWFSENWPEGVAWPDDVVRPPAVQEA